MTAISKIRYLLLLVLAIVPAGVMADRPVNGDEIAGLAFVSWKAVIDKVSKTGGRGYNVKAKLNFQGHTSEGHQIRGTGKMRFVSGPEHPLTIGDSLRGSDSLRYWATVKTSMGEDLVITEGTGFFDLSTTGSVLTTEVAIEFKAALDIYVGG